MLFLVPINVERIRTRRYLLECCASIPVACAPLQLSLALLAPASVQDGMCYSDITGNRSPPIAAASVL